MLQYKAYDKQTSLWETFTTEQEEWSLSRKLLEDGMLPPCLSILSKEEVQRSLICEADPHRCHSTISEFLESDRAVLLGWQEKQL